MMDRLRSLQTDRPCQTHRSGFRYAFALAAVLTAAGCGSDVPFDFVPVEGKLTYDDGTLIPAQKILMTFNPIVEKGKNGIVPPPGQTTVNVADGTFNDVSSYRPHDGVALGRHKVVVVAFESETKPSPAVPKIYRSSNSTPLEVEVSSKNQVLEIKVPKP